MCGITGFIGEGTQRDLHNMVDSLHHRGPDDRGIDWRPGVGLGQTRLSVLDLSPAGHQPMYNTDNTIGIVFNGEIYNYQELKRNLQDKGYVFKGSSDTEVILYLYQEYGEQCFEKMNGMFAIAIYSFLDKKLVLARDRLGKKPLYWSKVGETVVFGSELKSLLNHPHIKRDIDPISLNLYFFYEYVPSPRSIFKNVYKLNPGTFMVFNQEIRESKFWKLERRVQDISIDKSIIKLNSLINEAVVKRLVADVPLGVFLSGGLDSSAVAYYAQKNSVVPIKTFSIGFEDESFDESVYARQMADFLGTDHHHKILSAEDSLALIPRIAEVLDEPLGDASIVPTYLLSKFTKEYVTVVLGGDGGDELFAGYPTFQAERLFSWYKKIPKFIRKVVIEPSVRVLPVNHKSFSLDFKLKKFISATDRSPIRRHREWLAAFNDSDRKHLLKSDVYLLDNEIVTDLAPETSCDGNTLLSDYLHTYLQDGVLVKVDRASMMASLETRSPLLDYTVVDFVFSLPYAYKLRGLTTKYIFKKLMSDKLPRNIVNRSKKGFGMPISSWLRGELRDWCDTVLSQANIEKVGLFNYNYVAKLKDEHYSGDYDHRKKLWTLLVFQLWSDRWLNQ